MSDAPPPGWGQPPGPPPGQGYPPGPPGGYGQQPSGGYGQPPGGQGPGGYGQPPGGYGQPSGGYGQPPGGQGPGSFGPGGFGQPSGGFGPPPKKSNTGLIIGVVVLGLLVVGGLGAVLLLRSDDPDPIVASEDPVAQPTATAPVTQPTPSPFEEPTDPSAAEGTNQSVFELAVGTCFNDPSSAEEIQDVVSVPCEAPHDNEVFALVDYPAGAEEPFPGREAVSVFGDEQCLGQLFEDFVGIPYADSRFFATQLTPTEGSWEQGDREIVCLLYDPDAQTTGSVRGSAQ